VTRVFSKFRTIDETHDAPGHRAQTTPSCVEIRSNLANLCVATIAHVARVEQVADVATALHEAHFLYHADQGAENTGGWRAARVDGDGGAFAQLFVTVRDGVRVRYSTWQSCVCHDEHNFYGATCALDTLHAMIRSSIKFLRDGNRLHKCVCARPRHEGAAHTCVVAVTSRRELTPRAISIRHLTPPSRATRAPPRARFTVVQGP
jgi:hypothetical protein